jgi:hypothetical protein
MTAHRWADTLPRLDADRAAELADGYLASIFVGLGPQRLDGTTDVLPGERLLAAIREGVAEGVRLALLELARGSA